MTDRPRVALIMTGAPRTLPQLRQAQSARIQEIAAVADVDLFFHSWCPSVGWSATTTTTISSLSPRRVEFGRPWSREVSLPFPGVSPDPGAIARGESFVAMWTSALRGYELMVAEEERIGQRYDFVVRTRPDLLWDIVHEFQSLTSDGCNRIPRIYTAQRSPADVAAVLNRNDATAYFCLAQELPELDMHIRSKRYKAFVAEYALETHLDRKGIRWEEFSSPLMLVRDHGKPHWFRTGAAHRAYYAARSLMTSHGDNLPLPPSNDTLTADRVTVDLSTNVFNQQPAPAPLSERIAALWRGVRDADPSAMRDAVHLADDIPELHRRPASLLTTGVAHQAAHLLRLQGVPRRTLLAQSPLHVMLLAVRVSRYRVEEWMNDFRWKRRLTRSARGSQ